MAIRRYRVADYPMDPRPNEITSACTRLGVGVHF
jgi:hypothetical protein